MRAGTLRHVISLQSPPTGAPDSLGTPSGAWTTVYSGVRAEISPLRGREFMQAQQNNSEIEARVRIRYHSGILPTWRVIWGSRTFKIHAVLNPDMRNIMLELMCSELLAGA